MTIKTYVVCQHIVELNITGGQGTRIDAIMLHPNCVATYKDKGLAENRAKHVWPSSSKEDIRLVVCELVPRSVMDCMVDGFSDMPAYKSNGPAISQPEEFKVINSGVDFILAKDNGGQLWYLCIGCDWVKIPGLPGDEEQAAGDDDCATLHDLNDNAKKEGKDHENN